MLKKLGIVLLVVVSFDASSDIAWSPERDWELLNESLKGVTWDIGIALKHAQFRVNRRDDSKVFDSTLGEFKTIDQFSPVLSVKSSLTYFKNSYRWGYFIEAHYSETRFSKQFPEVGMRNDDLLADLGTIVRTKHVVLSPVLFYRNAMVHQANNRGFIAAFGMGYGYADLEGDIILTEIGSSARYAIDEKKSGISVILYLEYDIGDWFIKAKTLTSELNNQQYQFQTQDTTIEFGYSFIFGN